MWRRRGPPRLEAETGNDTIQRSVRAAATGWSVEPSAGDGITIVLVGAAGFALSWLAARRIVSQNYLKFRRAREAEMFRGFVFVGGTTVVVIATIVMLLRG